MERFFKPETRIQKSGLIPIYSIVFFGERVDTVHSPRIAIAKQLRLRDTGDERFNMVGLQALAGWCLVNRPYDSLVQ